MYHKPPRFAEKILSWLLYDDIWKTTLGDFEEYYNTLITKKGKRKADLWYWMQVLRYAPSKLIHSFYWTLTMFKNYLKIAFRSIKKNKSYSFINIFGLGVGLASFLLVGLFVTHELSYDKFYPDSERIFRVVKQNQQGDFLGSPWYAVTPAPLAQAMKEALPGVEKATYLSPYSSLITFDNNAFLEDGISVEGHFIEIFPQQWVSGNPVTALKNPKSIVLTESLSKKYFGDSNPIGKALEFTNQNSKPHTKTVTGLIKDPPKNSHLQFAYIFNDQSTTRYEREINHWGNNNDYTYIKLVKGASPQNINSLLPDLIRNRMISYNSYYESHPESIPLATLQPLPDIHLKSSHLNRNIGKAGDIKYVYVLSLIAIIILLLACVNYMNLATARSMGRAKEIGVRKVIGALRSNIRMQFTAEAVILSSISIVVAFFLVYLFFQPFKALVNRPLDIHIFLTPQFWLIITSAGLLSGLISGIYPAFYMSSLKPSAVLKNQAQGGSGNRKLRNLLVVGQFTITIALIMGSLVIFKQLDFIRSRDVGFDRKQILTVKTTAPERLSRYDVLSQNLKTFPNIIDVSSSLDLPTEIQSQIGDIWWPGKSQGEKLKVYNNEINFNYTDVLDIKIIAGHNFSENKSGDAGREFLINETAAADFGWTPDEAIDQQIELSEQKGTVAGVFTDFNFLSARLTMEPLVLKRGEVSNHQYLLIKVRPENMAETISFVEEQWNTFNPEYPFEYSFLDDAFDEMYRTEITLGKIFNYFTFLALFIACMGLFGLASFMMEKRTKEIGIRKVLGADLLQIIALLNKDFFKLVLISFLIAAPVGWYFSQNWLRDFAYKINVGPLVFIMTAGIAFGIALLTVSYKSVKAAYANPVESLKSE